MNNLNSEVESKLISIIGELSSQPDVANTYTKGTLSYDKQVARMKEFVEIGEYALAYELIVANLEKQPFVLSAKTSVRLLEVGLLMRYKTERAEDIAYDMRFRGANNEARE